MKSFGAYSLLAAVFPFVLADFHVDTVHNSVVTGPSSQDHWTSYVACPSNYFNCKCLVSSDRTGHVDGGNPGTGFFYIDSGFCGMGQMNFYDRGNGHWEYYLNGGDKIGDCYGNGNDGAKQCGITGGSAITTGGLVCYGYPCNA